MNNTTSPTAPPPSPSQIKRNKLASPFRRAITSYAYSPEPKPLSRRDKWCLEVAERKQHAKSN